MKIEPVPNTDPPLYNLLQEVEVTLADGTSATAYQQIETVTIIDINYRVDEMSKQINELAEQRSKHLAILSEMVAMETTEPGSE